MSWRRAFVVYREVARQFRQVAALGAFFLAVRVGWLAGIDALAHAQSNMSAGLQGAAGDKPSKGDSPIVEVQEAIDGPNNPHRPDLDKLREMGTKPPDVSTPDVFEKEAGGGAQLRRILVDVGPNRSEVFIGGQSVGHTPYVGQISCANGERVRIQVLPPQGVPITRSAICRGDTITSNE